MLEAGLPVRLTLPLSLLRFGSRTGFDRRRFRCRSAHDGSRDTGELAAVPIEHLHQRLRAVAEQMSGSRGSLPSPSPLRTGRDDLSSSGSSLGRLAHRPRVVSLVAPPMHQLQVGDLVRPAALARCVVVDLDEGDVLVGVERHAAQRTAIVLLP